jgi:hypothetical protein
MPKKNDVNSLIEIRQAQVTEKLEATIRALMVRSAENLEIAIKRHEVRIEALKTASINRLEAAIKALKAQAAKRSEAFVKTLSAQAPREKKETSHMQRVLKDYNNPCVFYFQTTGSRATNLAIRHRIAVAYPQHRIVVDRNRRSEWRILLQRVYTGSIVQIVALWDSRLLKDITKVAAATGREVILVDREMNVVPKQ